MGVGGSPCRIHCKLTYKTASRKTNARNRTSVWELEGAPAGFTVHSRMKQQVEKQTHQPNFGEGVGGSPCRIHCKFTYEKASLKNKRTQPNFGEGDGGSPCRIHCVFTYETATRKNKRTQPNFGVGFGGSPCRIHCTLAYETASRNTNAPAELR